MTAAQAPGVALAYGDPKMLPAQAGSAHEIVRYLESLSAQEWADEVFKIRRAAKHGDARYQRVLRFL